MNTQTTHTSNRMMPKFAKAIAANMREIAVATTHIILIDEKLKGQDTATRAELVKRVEKAESNIAAILQEPGANRGL